MSETVVLFSFKIWCSNVKNVQQEYHHFSTEWMSLRCICSVSAKVQHFCHDVSQAVTFETISLPYYCGVGDSQIYCDSFSSAKAVPPLVLCSRTTLMCWMDCYDHCFSFVYSWTCCIILWHVALLACHHHKHLCHLVNFCGGNRCYLYTVANTTVLRSLFFWNMALIYCPQEQRP